MCEGGLRRHVKRSHKAYTKDKRTEALKTLANHCEEEPDAGGRIPSFPQTCVSPEHPHRRAGVRGIATLLCHLGVRSPSGNGLRRMPMAGSFSTRRELEKWDETVVERTTRFLIEGNPTHARPHDIEGF